MNVFGLNRVLGAGVIPPVGNYNRQGGEDTPAPNNVNRIGICENVQVFGALESSTYLNKLVFRNLNVGPVYTSNNSDNNLVNLTGYLGIMLFSRLRERNRMASRMLGLAESVIPDMPVTSFLSTGESRAEIVSVFTSAWNDICDNPESGPIVANYYTVWSAAVTAGNADENNQFTVWGDANTTVREININRMSVEKCVRLLLEFAESLSETVKARSLAPLLGLIISYAKRGQVSSPWLNRISRDLEMTMQRIVSNVDSDMISQIWALFGRNITDENANGVFMRWKAIIPGAAIRLRVAMDQANGSGLTSLDVIVKAFAAHTGFKWNVIRRLFPDEFVKVLESILAVGNNGFYGYRSQLGVVRSTNYKNISWVAKELMIRGSGEANYVNYRGWVAIPKEQQALEKLLVEYLATRSSNVDITSPMNDDEVNLMGEMGAAVGGYYLNI